MVVSREELYAQVWAEPMTTVAARYNVSSSFLGRVCERLNVPRPPRGYWAQLAVGKQDARPALPEVRPGDELEWSRSGESRRAPLPLPQPPPLEAESAPAETIARRGRRHSHHPLLIGAREHFEAAKQSSSFLDDGFPRPSKRLLVDISVSKESLDRTLSLANKLFLFLEDRNYRVDLAPRGQQWHRPEVDHREDGGPARYRREWTPDRPTLVYLGTLAIGLTIFELSEHVEVEYVDGKWVRLSPKQVERLRRYRQHAHITKTNLPSGRLAVRAYSPYPRATWQKEWREAQPRELSARFEEILDDLLKSAPTIVELIAEGERQAEIERQRWEEQQRKWEREEAERRRKEAEAKRAQARKDSREQLITLVEDWALARHVEEFFNLAMQNTASIPADDRDALVARIERARQMLGGLDPLTHFQRWRAPEER